MFGLITLFTILSLALANTDLKHDVNVDIVDTVRLKDELRRQGDLTDRLLKRVDVQEKQIQQLSDRISEQDKIIAKQAEQISILESREIVHNENLPARKDNHTSSETITSVNGNDKIKTSINRELQYQRRAPEPRIRAFQQSPVAFHATINAAGNINHITIGQTIVFDKVKFSIGGGYHSQHGLFIAPKAGIYIFSVSALSSDHNHLQVALEKNGVVLAITYASSYREGTRHEQGSVTVVTQLSIGDEVCAVNTYPDDTSIHTDDFTSFMGCLITEI
ncbi:hypothetical protein ACF0H5_016345 [Mactra antiquata]